MQQLLFAEYEIESYYNTLDVSVEDIMELDHMHGTCKQFHSELKSDMGIERMQSVNSQSTIYFFILLCLPSIF